MAVSEITLESLTTGALNGTGVFDALMRTARIHLDDQFNSDRLRGAEYAEVYLGQLQSSLQTALEFLVQQKKLPLEAQLLEKQIELADKQLEKADAELAQIRAQTELIESQKVNADLEGKVLIAQECKLRAEFDYTQKNTLKAAAETTLLTQRVATEKAQILGLGVDEDSVIGRQKGLYVAQTQGFRSDRIQKAANIYMDMWKTCRMTDDAWQANATQGLDDVTLGTVMRQLRTDIGVVPA